MHYGDGLVDVAAQFADRLARWPDEPLLSRALEILRARFASDERMPGARKDGPISFARFLADPGRRDLDARNRQDAASVIDLFMQSVDTQRSANLVEDDT
jgi:hypothetical protein